MRKTRAVATLLVLVVIAVPAIAQDESPRVRTGRQIGVGDRIDASGGSSVPAPARSARPSASIKTESTPANDTADAFVAAVAGLPVDQGGNAFGTRDPRPCDRVTSRPSAAEAAALVQCAREGQSRRNVEYLVQDVVVAAFSAGTDAPRVPTGLTNADPGVAPLAIRGSLAAWNCRPVDGPGMMAKFNNAGRNCNRQVERHAAGYCYKRQDGAWSCSMKDPDIADADRQYDLPPPR